MNRPSSTIQAAAIAGGAASVAFGVFSIFDPVHYAMVPAGMEAGTAVLIGAVIGWKKKENVLPLKKTK